MTDYINIRKIKTYIMKHYWINIDSNEKRRNYMTKQYEKLHLEHYRVSAFTPKDFDEILVQKRPLTCKFPGCNTCEYEFACISSHVKAIQEGLKSGDEYFIVMEDDIYMPFTIDYDALVKDIPRDTEILQMLVLYGPTVMQLFKMYQTTGFKYFRWKYLLPSTGMYMISRKGAQKIVDMFYDSNIKKYDFSKSPYQIVADVCLYESAVTYATTLPYAYPNTEMGSEIHPDHLTSQSSAVVDIKSIINHSRTMPFPFVKSFNRA